MHVFTVYTATHKPMLDEFFLPSLGAHEPDLPVTAIEMQQRSPSGIVKSLGYLDTLRDKYDALWEFANSLPYGEIIVCSDCDIQFFKPFASDLLSYLEKLDVVFQTNTLVPHRLNIGFTCLRWLPSTRVLLNAMMNSAEHFTTEEVAANFLLRIYGFPVRYRLLPADDYWTVHSTVSKEFSPDTVPPTPFMHHGNSALGIDHKIMVMRGVRAVVQGRLAPAAALSLTG